MTDLQIEARNLEDERVSATHSERVRMQSRIDRVVTTLTLNGFPVPPKLRNINNTLKDEALDEMFDNMPV